MSITENLIREMDREAISTRKMLERIPNDKYDWKPHPKNMTIRELATHLAELPTWIKLVLTTSELDFAVTPYEPVPLHNTSELLSFFDEALLEGKSHLAMAQPDDFVPIWTMKNGAEIYSSDPKEEVIRMVYCQIVHHRAQLGMYLRLLNIPIPGCYGPSADEMGI